MRWLLCVALLASAATLRADDPSVDELRSKVSALFSAQAEQLSQTNDDFRATLDRLEKSVERLEKQGAAGCGDNCPCPKAAVVAPNPPKTVAAAPAVAPANADLVIFTDAHCVHGKRWIDEEKAKWEAMGHTVAIQPATGDVCPQFQFRGESSKYNGFVAASTLDAILKQSKPPALAAAVVYDGVRFDPPAVASSRSGRCYSVVGPAGRRWHMSGGDGNVNRLARHVITAHARDGVTPQDVSGRSFSELQNIHSHAHEGTWRSYKSRLATRGGYAVSAPAVRYVRQAIRYARPAVVMRSGGCPNGMCPR